jgi:hypothetical protein
MTEFIDVRGTIGRRLHEEAGDGDGTANRDTGT